MASQPRRNCLAPITGMAPSCADPRQHTNTAPAIVGEDLSRGDNSLTPISLSLLLYNNNGGHSKWEITTKLWGVIISV